MRSPVLRTPQREDGDVTASLVKPGRGEDSMAFSFLTKTLLGPTPAPHTFFPHYTSQKVYNGNHGHPMRNANCCFFAISFGCLLISYTWRATPFNMLHCTYQNSSSWCASLTFGLSSFSSPSPPCLAHPGCWQSAKKNGLKRNEPTDWKIYCIYYTHYIVSRLKYLVSRPMLYNIISRLASPKL